ncbi:MAG: hypothetical protein ACPGLV_12220, partial [Bacteroidia bacterium]
MTSPFKKQIKTILSVILICFGLTVRADAGVPGLGEAMWLIGIAVFVCFILVTFAISALICYTLNSATKEKRENIWLIFFVSLLFSSATFFIHGIGDLSFSPLYIMFNIISGFIGGTIGYFLSKKIKNKNKVIKFIEKPNLEKAKKIIKKNAYWNSGMFFLTK